MNEKAIELAQTTADMSLNTILETTLLLKTHNVLTNGDGPYDFAREVIAKMTKSIDDHEAKSANINTDLNNVGILTDDQLIDHIVLRAQEIYGFLRIDADRMRKALACAHRTNPIRLAELLETCLRDFYRDVIMGAYRHYDETTDTITG